MSKASELKRLWREEYDAGNFEEALKLEKAFIDARRKEIDELDNEIKKSKSIEFKRVIDEIENDKPKPKIETGINALDINLVEYYDGHNKGGLELGNFILLTGVKGAGKTTLVTRLIAGFSQANKVNWFNFEMSKKQAYRIIKKFESIANWDNLLYYAGDRDIEEIIDEIKFNSTLGVQHFFIDSLMKIESKAHKDKVEKYSYISDRLSAVAKQLNINIYLIAQVSQETERNGGFGIKHGNDIEYDADYIFILYKKPIKEGNKILEDDFGNKLYYEDKRILKCFKNRVDERLFAVEVAKEDLTNQALPDYEVVEVPTI